MTTTAQRDHDRPGPYRVLGTRPIRHDGWDKVTGTARYGADIQLPGMLHGMILRSPHAHAVAAVAATNRHIAEDALKLIEVDYELLPMVLTLHDAMQPEAPLLHEEMTTGFRVERFARGDDTGVKSKIAGHIK